MSVNDSIRTPTNSAAFDPQWGSNAAEFIGVRIESLTGIGTQLAEKRIRFEVVTLGLGTEAGPFVQ